MFDFLGDLVKGGFDLYNSSKTRELQQQQINQNMDLAKHGLGYRVEDAVAHGLSPLIGAGVNPASGSSVSVGNDAMSDAGQSFGRAIKALGSAEDREKEDRKTVALAHERQHLENDTLRADLVSKVRREAQQLGPPFPLNWSSMVSGERSPKRSASGFALDDDKMKQKEESAPTVRSLPVWGLPLKTYPGRASAQDIENEYGDEGPVPMVAGTGNFIQDSLYTMGQSGPWQAFERGLRKNWWKELRGGDRSRWSRGQRNMRGGE